MRFAQYAIRSIIYLDRPRTDSRRINWWGPYSNTFSFFSAEELFREFPGLLIDAVSNDRW